MLNGSKITNLFIFGNTPPRTSSRVKRGISEHSTEPHSSDPSNGYAIFRMTWWGVTIFISNNTPRTSYAVKHVITWIVLFFSLLGTGPSLAAIAAKQSEAPNILHGLQPIFTFTAGASISQLGQSQSFAPLDLCYYHYTPQGSKTNMLWGGSIGTEVKHTSSWGVIAGLGYYQPTSLVTKGTLTQGADLSSENVYNYRYQTQSQQLLAEGHFYWIAKEKIQPFFMLGIGAAFNKTSNYQTNVPPFFEFTPVFSNLSQTNFTYVIGPGVDLSLTQSFRIGVSYRFADLGSANTGQGQIDGITISNTLKQSHVYANQILAQFTYIPWNN